ncbi:flagellar hook-associated protein FlgK [Bacillus carboniphilus]|uniref:Flagellar hook-associated protein 1 n=1 Tax=Bacillus carboniphilus TaxID=86663 RepID=A0ABN0VW62_9BACI
MSSTFHGLETARRAMFTQQSALYTTGHNVANANTPGYSRQRVNFTQTEPFPNAAMNRPGIPGQIGTGVKAAAIQRMRESFLDVQFRGESSKLGYWDTKAKALEKMEEIMNEPSESGLSNTMDQFWQSLQDLAVNPTNEGARSVVRQRGIALAETFNYVSDSLTAIKNDFKNEINIAKDKINSLLEQISSVNGQIADVEPHGYVPNDLYDKRDVLIDELSSMVNIKVNYVKSGGDPSDVAEGQAIVKLADDAGSDMAILVSQHGYSELKIGYNGPNGSVDEISVGGKTFTYDQFQSHGELKGLIESFGYADANGAEAGIYSDMLASVDNLAYTFAKEFNTVHKDGMSPNEIENGNQNIAFFGDSENGGVTILEGFAKRMVVTKAIIDSVDNIANATPDADGNATLGDSTNILALANIFEKGLNYEGPDQKSSFRSYYESIIGDMAVNSQEAVRLAANTTVLKDSVDQKRMSVSSVSLDEEMTNMIKFQHGYNAAARMITLTDELLDKIINGMGTGGR